MAGYMTKLNGYVYNGAFAAAEELQNGQFAEITAEGVALIKEKKDTVMRVAEKTTLWGMDAVVLDVVSVGDNEVFFVENEWDINDAEEYDTAKYKVKKGVYVRMHRPVVNDQLIMTVEAGVAAALAVGDLVAPAAGGTIAKNA